MKPTAPDFLGCLRDARAGMVRLHAGLAGIDPADTSDLARLRAGLAAAVDAAKEGIDGFDQLIGFVLLAVAQTPAPPSQGGPFGRIKGQR